MSQRPKDRGRRRLDLSQPSTSSQAMLEEEDMEVEEEDVTSTQTNRVAKKAVDAMDPSVLKRKVSEMVRYLLCAEGRKAPVRRKELTDKVLCEYSRAFPIIFDQANDQLKTVFGLRVEEIMRGKTKCYVLINNLPAESREGLVHCPKQEKAQMGLLCVVLSLIMMKRGTITEEQLWNCLQRLGLSNDSGSHSTFGDVKRLISKEFVDQMYLDRDRTAAGDSYLVKYSWGPRAQVELDKKEVLAFVAEIYEGDLSQWERQFSDILDGSAGEAQEK